MGMKARVKPVVNLLELSEQLDALKDAVDDLMDSVIPVEDEAEGVVAIPAGRFSSRIKSATSKISDSYGALFEASSDLSCLIDELEELLSKEEEK